MYAKLVLQCVYQTKYDYAPQTPPNQNYHFLIIFILGYVKILKSSFPFKYMLYRNYTYIYLKRLFFMVTHHPTHFIKTNALKSNIMITRNLQTLEVIKKRGKSSKRYEEFLNPKVHILPPTCSFYLQPFILIINERFF